LAAANQIPVTYWQARHAIPKGRLAPLAARLRLGKQNAAAHTNMAAPSKQASNESIALYG
jgi:hypothetical protein